MTIAQRIAREPALVAGLVQSLIALFVAFGLDLTADQIATILAVTAAVLALVTRALVSPAAEVVAQQRPDEKTPIAGPSGPIPDGVPVAVVPLD
ncbi:MAG: hypothetical protein H6515_14540 [Microthrixaceae bacterium]|jgi:hypothetical protein|nr:hypothetical protein [Microthrixaceae bacterium]